MSQKASVWAVAAVVALLGGGCGLEAIPFVTCGPGNCAGCCSSEGVCLGGTDSSACGFGGDLCGACSPHQACLSQACSMDGSQVWILQPVSAVIADTNNGSTWDDLGGAAPDPYVVIAGARTPEASDTWTPSWNTGFELTTTALFEGVPVQVMDSDAFSHDSITPSGFIQLTEADFAAGGKRYENWGGVVSIDFVLQKKP